MRCAALSQVHRVMGREAEKRAQKEQEHGGEKLRVWNNTYWERNWKKLKRLKIHSFLWELELFCLRWHQHQAGQFLTPLCTCPPSPAACIASSEQAEISQSRSCPFYINGLKHRPSWTAASLWFLRWFSSFQQHSTQFVKFSEAFYVLNWEGWVQRRKGLKTFEVFLFHKPEKMKMSQRKAPIQNRFIYCEIAFHEVSFKGY